MAVAKIEVMGSKKLLGITILAIVLQMAFFIIPSYFIPNSADTILLDAKNYPYTRYGYDENMCRADYLPSFYTSTNEQWPYRYIFRLPRINYDGSLVDYSKWHSKVIGVLTVSKNDTANHSVFTRWSTTLFACNYNRYESYKYGPSFFTTQLNEPVSQKYSYYHMNYNNKKMEYSTTTTLLEFETALYDKYTLTIQSDGFIDQKEFNRLYMSLMLTIPNVDFSEFMVYLKTIFFALAMLFLAWYRLRFYKHVEVYDNRDCATFALGLALLCLNIPVEWFTFFGPSNFLLYTKDVRTDIYYVVLAVCCRIFVSEYITPTNPAGLRAEKRYSTSIIIATVSCCILTIAHTYLNYMDVNYALSNISSSRTSYYFLILLVVSIIVVAVVYTICLTAIIQKALSNRAGSGDPQSLACHRRSRRSVLPLMSTLICVLFTLIEFITCEVVRYQTTWISGPSQKMKNPVALSVGVFSLWNIYTLMMMYLYAPERQEESTSTAITAITRPGLELMPLPIASTAFPNPEVMLPPSYDEYLRSINAENAAGGSNAAKKSNVGEENI